MSDKIDAIICGSCVLDIIARPVDLHQPIMGGSLHAVETPAALAGGITSNTGIAMARQGLRVGVASYVGEDRWGGVIRQTLDDEGIDSSLLLTHDTAPTSTTIVLVDQHGERSFLHAQGAPKQIDAGFFLDRLDAFTRANWIVLGYYPLIPKLIDDLPNVFEKIRQGGSRVMLESAGGLDRGGAMRPLDRVLAQVDAYIPSLDEAVCQTGLSAADDPRRMIEVYRRHTGQVLLGIKLGGERGRAAEPVGRRLCAGAKCARARPGHRHYRCGRLFSGWLAYWPDPRPAHGRRGHDGVSRCGPVCDRRGRLGQR